MELIRAEYNIEYHSMREVDLDYSCRCQSETSWRIVAIKQAPVSCNDTMRPARRNYSTWVAYLTHLASRQYPIFVALLTSSIVYKHSLTASLHLRSRQAALDAAGQICEYD